MLDLALIRAEPARVRAALERRGVDPHAVAVVVDLDSLWADRQEVCEVLRQRRRRISEEFARAKDLGRGTADFEELGRTVAEELRRTEADLARLEAQRLNALLALPNLPATDVPDAPPEPATGAAAASPAAQTPAPGWPKPFAPLAHWDLLEILKLAATIEAPGLGRGWLAWRGRGARLVRALTDLMLDVHVREFGYEEIRVPAVAGRSELVGSAHLPTLEGKMYAVSPSNADLFLAPRAEPHLAGLYAGRILDAAALPIRLVSAGPAFRREAAPGGASGRGLARLHQFDTVELYAFCRAQDEEAELSRAVAAAEAILARLQVPFRRRLRAATDLSHAAAKTVDLEVWAPGMKEWLAVAAISSFTDYQARRTQTRWRNETGRARLVHTVGGAAVALPRLVAALLENFQESDGTLRLPPPLAQRMGEESH